MTGSQHLLPSFSANQTEALAGLILPAIVAAVIGVLGWLLSRLIRSFDDSTNAQQLLSQELTFLKANMQFIHAGMHDVPKLKEDVAVLKRDLTTAWKHIDALEGRLTQKP